MRTIKVLTTTGKDQDNKPITKIVPETVYKISELSYLDKLFSCKESKRKDPETLKTITYLEIPAAFDIETTTITSDPDSQQLNIDRDAYQYLKNVKIKYNENIKKSIPDFETLRRSYFGKLKLSKKEGYSADSLYQELNGLYPHLFPDDIYNEVERFEKILEVFDTLEPKKDDFRPFGFMYHWQFCLEDQVVFGRTWEEFKDLMGKLEHNMHLSNTNRLVVWVHNLSFEWSFMRQFIEFESGFFLEERKPAKILTKGGIEFRCSYILSNMSLSKFCENEKGVIHYKMDGDIYDYEKIRTPITLLSEYEESYCYNDVRGLCECINSRLQSDTLATIPLTSTGYVRRDLRNSWRKNKKNREYFRNSKLDSHLYKLCRDAFRGGDTHANSARADQINTNVWSFDLKSSYPAIITEFDGFPFSAFAKMKPATYINNDVSEYAFLIKIAFRNIRYDVHGKHACGMPYIALAKCTHHSSDCIIDNGRVVYASLLELVVTDLDLEIIKGEYLYDDIKAGEIWAAKKGKLPKEIRDITLDYFRKKTELDGIEEMAYEYVKSKNRINAIFGCMVMKIDQTLVKWDDGKQEYIDETPDLEKALNDYYKSRNNFLSYQQGLFITAAARKRLRDMLWTVGKDCIYCDTDSIKGIGDHFKEFEAKNEELKALSIQCGAYAEDRNGNIKYMGVWENETKDHLYEEFKTLGAKKYVYREGDKIKSTIAGVSKKAGAAYFTKTGVEGFKRDAVITESGHLTAYYNDDPVHTIIIDHCKITTGANVALVNNQYKIGVTEDYLDLLVKGLDNIVDMI